MMSNTVSNSVASIAGTKEAKDLAKVNAISAIEDA